MERPRPTLGTVFGAHFGTWTEAHADACARATRLGVAHAIVGPVRWHGRDFFVVVPASAAPSDADVVPPGTVHRACF